MRSYNCYYSQSLDLKKKTVNNNSACWAGMRILSPKYGQYYLHINKFREKETEKYIDLLLSTINKITPCYIKDDEIIFKTYKGTYDQNLILLNFIRNLWCEQNNYKEYNQIFFKTLEEYKDVKDPMCLLSFANIQKTYNYPPGHSNILGSKGKVKTLAEFEKYTGSVTVNFFK
jgi:hypothetical protein